MPSLSSFCAVVNPFMPFSTMKAVMQRLPASRPAVRMYTSSTSASGPLVIHILEPLATHTSPFFSARQLIEPTTSEPAPGSLMASAPTYSPEHSLGTYLLALCLVAVVEDVVHAQVRVRAVGQADRAGGARDLLHRHHVRQVAQVRAAVVAADGDAEQAHLAELLPQVVGEGVLAVDAVGARGDLLLREGRHALAQHVEVVTEGKGRMGGSCPFERAVHGSAAARDGHPPSVAVQPASRRAIAAASARSTGCCARSRRSWVATRWLARDAASPPASGTASGSTASRSTCGHAGGLQHRGQGLQVVGQVVGPAPAARGCGGARAALAVRAQRGQVASSSWLAPSMRSTSSGVGALAGRVVAATLARCALSSASASCASRRARR